MKDFSGEQAKKRAEREKKGVSDKERLVMVWT